MVVLGGGAVSYELGSPVDGAAVSALVALNVTKKKYDVFFWRVDFAAFQTKQTRSFPSPRRCTPRFFSSSLLLSSLELSATKVYEPYTRALLGTAAHFFKAVEASRARSRTIRGADGAACERDRFSIAEHPSPAQHIQKDVLHYALC